MHRKKVQICWNIVQQGDKYETATAWGILYLTVNDLHKKCNFTEMCENHI